MYRKSFAEQHPILLSFGILFGAAFLVALWPVFLAVVLLGGTGYLICAAAAASAAIQRPPRSPATSPGSAGRLRALAAVARPHT